MLVGAVDDDGEALDDRSLRDQLMTLLLAGHETSATTLAWAFEELLRVPGEQERLIAEAEAVLGGAPVEADHLPKLERIDSAIKEALRLHPVTGATARKLMKPATIGGHELPAGVVVVAVMYLTHRRPELYPEPERFIGDRFIGKKIDPYAWAPFGGGIRRCLGMAFALHEMKVILATMFGMGLRLELEKQGPYETTMRSIVFAPRGGRRASSCRGSGRSGAAERGPATRHRGPFGSTLRRSNAPKFTRGARRRRVQFLVRRSARTRRRLLAASRQIHVATSHSFEGCPAGLRAKVANGDAACDGSLSRRPRGRSTVSPAHLSLALSVRRGAPHRIPLRGRRTPRRS
jgi:hypothetical protein